MHSGCRDEPGTSEVALSTSVNVIPTTVEPNPVHTTVSSTGPTTSTMSTTPGPG